MGLRCRAIIRTDIGKNDVLTVLSDSHRLIDEFWYFKHRFVPKDWQFDAQNFGCKVPILRFLGAEEVSAEAILATVFGQNVV